MKTWTKFLKEILSGQILKAGRLCISISIHDMKKKDLVVVANGRTEIRSGIFV